MEVGAVQLVQVDEAAEGGLPLGIVTVQVAEHVPELILTRSGFNIIKISIENFFKSRIVLHNLHIVFGYKMV